MKCWREVIRLHRELGLAERTLGRAAWTLRHGERGEWRGTLRDAAAETLREARRAASRYDADRLREVAGYYTRLARCPFAEAASLMLKPGERAAANGRGPGRPEQVARAAEHRVLRHLWVIDDDTARRARENRERTIESVLNIFRGRGIAGDTTGNSPGTKWTAFNAISEHLDYGRRYTARTNQVQRSFEDTALKQRALDLVVAA